MTDVFYPLGPGSLHHDLELKASMWSTVRHLKNFGRFFIAGEVPRCSGLPKFTHLPGLVPTGRSKEHRIQANLRAALGCSEVSDEFLYMNDDFFFIADCDALTYPHYIEGTIDDELGRRVAERSTYGNTIANAHRQLVKRGLPRNDFHTHSPFRCTKRGLEAVFQEFDFTAREAPAWKLLYGNFHLLTPTMQPGCKISEPLSAKQLARAIEGRNCFSVGDDAMNGKALLEMLKDYYENTKSKHSVSRPPPDGVGGPEM